MRPISSTAVASSTTSPAPDIHSEPRWTRCQSVASPWTALYWHIGETTMRLAKSWPPRRIGEKSWLMRDPCWGLPSDAAPAVHREHGAGDHVGLVRAQEQGRVRDILWRREAA